MDIEEFIKIQEPCFKYQDDNYQLFKYQPFGQLYDQQSHHHQSSPPFTIDEILQSLQERQGFIDSPIQELVDGAKVEFQLDQVQVQYFCRRIKKIKNVMKRDRARYRTNRKQKYPQIMKSPIVKEQSQISRDSTEMEKQIKKQRNRISAQISRDRKKNYVNNLQKQYKQLFSEAETLRKQNDKLKKQIEKKSISSSKGSYYKQLQQNKFVKFLIMLGMVFFLYLLGDALKTDKPEELQQVTQMETNTKQISISHKNFEQFKIMTEQEEEQCFTILQQQYGDRSVKDRVMKAISDIKHKTRTYLLPLSIQQKLRNVIKQHVA